MTDRFPLASGRATGGGSAKNAPSDLAESALVSPRSAAAEDVSVSDKGRAFAIASDAGDDGTHANVEPRATDDSRSRMTVEGKVVVPKPLESDGTSQIEAAEDEAALEGGRRKS